MWDFISPVNLIRYLIVWRVNSALVQLPKCLSTELSLVLGRMMAGSLPTQQAREWHKALAPWDKTVAPSSPSAAANSQLQVPARDQAATGPVPEAAWPIEAVLFVYPGKRTYGQGEVIPWELKLIGPHADHGLFLELILPAMEKAASTLDPNRRRPNNLWGRFDVQAIYAARGSQWEPVVKDGRLDLRYQPSPNQWAEGLEFGLERQFHRLTWITPFDLGVTSDASDKADSTRRANKIPEHEVPTLESVLEALMIRMTLFLPGKHQARRTDEVWRRVNPEEQTALWLELQEARRHTPLHRHKLEPAPRDWPGRWIGSQTLAIPRRILPYLELASILHIGKQTHFGCGTFMLT